MPGKKKIIIDGIIGLDVYGRGIRYELNQSEGGEVEIDLASPGGFVFDGLEIFNIIHDYSKNQNTVTIRMIGLAASMASYIALAGDKLIMEDNAVFMIHNAWGFAIGDYREMKKNADFFEGISNLLAKKYAKKSGMPMSEIRELMDAETWYFGDEAKKAGFVDEVIKTTKSGSENSIDKNGIIALAKGRVKDTFDKIQQSEKAKKDLERAAALIPYYVNAAVEKPQDTVTSYKPNAKLIDEPWDKASSEQRWRDHVGVESSEDLPKPSYTKRFAYFDPDNNDSFGGYKLPHWDYKSGNGEFVNIAAVRNGKARLSQTQGIPPEEKTKIENNLQKYLDRYNEEKQSNDLEEKNMTLDEFLAQNPTAKAEYDKRLGDAREDGRKEMQNKVNKVVNYIGNENYKGMEPLAKKVLSGESTLDALDGAVVAFDMLKEQIKSGAAKEDTNNMPVITPDNPQISADGVVNTIVDINALKERIKGAK